jgi:ABC-type Fe3+/spermidine/putrescine transport system ATPase subunit
MKPNEQYAVVLEDVKKTFDGNDFILKGINLKIPKGLNKWPN